MRKFTVYRCPKCTSRYINRVTSDRLGYHKHLCARCGEVIYTKKIFHKD